MRRIPEEQRVAILADALATSAPEAAGRWGVSEHTIWKWAEAVGGLTHIRELYEARRVAAASDAAIRLASEAKGRMGKLSDQHVVALFGELLRLMFDGAKPVIPGIVNIAGARASAPGTPEDEPDRVAAIIGVLANAGLLQAGGRGGTHTGESHLA